ncbi:MAG: ribosome biogenesis GTP-binding protein YihA/YsxC [Oscillospiraceae bacterium]
MNFNNVEFIKSVVSPSEFVRDSMAQIVFAGKSNVGKSSVINRLLNRKNFARVGAEPGKTVHINYFLVDRRAYLVDLPGYGYAKVSKAERERWGKLMEQYFACEAIITHGVMIVDARHKPTSDDITMAGWFLGTGCPMTIVANKVDKVKPSELSGNLAVIRETLRIPEETEIIPFSAEKGTNSDKLAAAVQRAVTSKREPF